MNSNNNNDEFPFEIIKMIRGVLKFNNNDGMVIKLTISRWKTLGGVYRLHPIQVLRGVRFNEEFDSHEHNSSSLSVNNVILQESEINNLYRLSHYHLHHIRSFTRTHISTSRILFDHGFYRLHPIQGLGGERLEEEGLPSFSLQYRFFLLRHSTIKENLIINIIVFI